MRFRTAVNTVVYPVHPVILSCRPHCSRGVPSLDDRIDRRFQGPNYLANWAAASSAPIAILSTCDAVGEPNRALADALFRSESGRFRRCRGDRLAEYGVGVTARQRPVLRGGRVSRLLLSPNAGMIPQPRAQPWSKRQPSTFVVALNGRHHSASLSGGAMCYAPLRPTAVALANQTRTVNQTATDVERHLLARVENHLTGGYMLIDDVMSSAISTHEVSTNQSLTVTLFTRESSLPISRTTGNEVTGDYRCRARSINARGRKR